MTSKKIIMIITIFLSVIGVFLQVKNNYTQGEALLKLWYLWVLILLFGIGSLKIK